MLHVLVFLCFLMMILMCKMAPKCSAKVLPHVPKQKKAVMCLKEKIHVLGGLRSGMSQSCWP